jgi:hypothetical protein
MANAVRTRTIGLFERREQAESVLDRQKQARFGPDRVRFGLHGCGPLAGGGGVALRS